ncbi:hypothetical protein CONPUDRAFT_159500 [Coniophora puteana RWD-64-598 SS2]|uniref:Uncharacterized protein n=1 Tax=Coniophora puteana (strain RWD-64-598) TaxID=741705 RepID=A0A5M3M882_CONPW|nr:uncharacterized protein CONPUDRAFT_159500 [Coniophora puteana RWD-64-598 SS2]EIW75379.1 hypothetical protein CONPUDRAFT_159500 [Coniophora puteana RWD-64-598 SS2]
MSLLILSFHSTSVVTASPLNTNNLYVILGSTPSPIPRRRTSCSAAETENVPSIPIGRQNNLLFGPPSRTCFQPQFHPTPKRPHRHTQNHTYVRPRQRLLLLRAAQVKQIIHKSDERPARQRRILDHTRDVAQLANGVFLSLSLCLSPPTTLLPSRSRFHSPATLPILSLAHASNASSNAPPPDDVHLAELFRLCSERRSLCIVSTSISEDEDRSTGLCWPRSEGAEERHAERGHGKGAGEKGAKGRGG